MKLDINSVAMMAANGCLSFTDHPEICEELIGRLQEELPKWNEDFKFDFVSRHSEEVLKNEISREISAFKMKYCNHLRGNAAILNNQIHSGLKVRVLKPLEMGLPASYEGLVGILEPHAGPLLQLTCNLRENPIVVTQMDAVYGVIEICCDQKYLKYSKS